MLINKRYLLRCRGRGGKGVEREEREKREKYEKGEGWEDKKGWGK